MQYSTHWSSNIYKPCEQCTYSNLGKHQQPDPCVKLGSVNICSHPPLNVTTPVSFQTHFLYWTHQRQWKHHQAIYNRSTQTIVNWAHTGSSLFLLPLPSSIYWHFYLSLLLNLLPSFTHRCSSHSQYFRLLFAMVG